MKKILTGLLFLCCVSSAWAMMEIDLSWNKVKQSNIVGYDVYMRELGQSYNYNLPCGSVNQEFDGITILSLDENKTYYFIVRAKDDKGRQSADSNEVCSNDTPPEYPYPPPVPGGCQVIGRKIKP